MKIPTLPFSALVVSVDFPKSKGYPTHPQTLGEQILKARMDKKLSQTEAAALFNVSKDSLFRWENNQSLPSKRYGSSIKSFLEI